MTYSRENSTNTHSNIVGFLRFYNSLKLISKQICNTQRCSYIEKYVKLRREDFAVLVDNLLSRMVGSRGEIFVYLGERNCISCGDWMIP
jgi:hypothetical protein